MAIKETVRLHPDYVMHVLDFMTPVEIAEGFTLGDLCRLIDKFDEMNIELFSDLIQCPLSVFFEECLRPEHGEQEPASDLHYIRFYWECEYDQLSETEWPPATSLGLYVDGIGKIWEEYRPKDEAYEDGKAYSDYNRYGISLTPLYALRDLPLRVDPVMKVRQSLPPEGSEESLLIPAPEVTLLQLIHALFWEVSFHGPPKKRDAFRAELERRVKRIENGEEKLIPFEEVKKDLEKKFGKKRDLP